LGWRYAKTKDGMALEALPARWTFVGKLDGADGKYLQLRF